ncbi:MAG: glycogen/starch/alpha-glucan phosphorylase [Acidaminococcaceae bacterium]|nr:glycogen/starch/alpha-glucan phosphorylase [Acidaminococcaceae bacterium]
MRSWKDKSEFKRMFTHKAHTLWEKSLRDLTKNEVYQTLAYMVRDLVSEDWIHTNDVYEQEKPRQVYYFSIEFLLGRLLQSNLVSCDMEGICREGLQELGWNLDDIIPEEADAGLGNGGLGRLAACFIDSLAALKLPGHGCSIRYQYGLFDQKIVDGQQVELPDVWLRKGFPWEVQRLDKAVNVRFGGDAYMEAQPDGSLKCQHKNYMNVRAVPYDVPILGYRNNTVNTLRLWKAEYTREDISRQLQFGDVRHAMRYKDSIQMISRYLYPEDSTWEGRKLRLMQEYFFVSAGVQSIVKYYKKKYGDIRQFDQFIAMHINDTHPALIIPELMRILLDEEGLSWEEAWKITVNSVAYTNHTVMPEAMERWPIPMFKELLPRIYLVVEEIHNQWQKRVRELFSGDENKQRQAAILWGSEVHMAHLAVVGSHSVNGVAAIHSQILKDSALHTLYQCFPDRFNNKTNGISHRRWLIQSNPELAALIDSAIGDGWRLHPDKLIDLAPFAEDAEFRHKFWQVKQQRKQILAAHILKTWDEQVDPGFMFDIQVKRFHMYKRQLLNILHVMYLFGELKKNPQLDVVPRVYMFGGKAAAGYGEAKMTIKLVNTVAQMVNNDPEVNKKLRVLFLENYNVSLGQLLFPAADVSEQISTAGKEASGTSNMKFMLNGALTLGTLDGANVEIRQAVGPENCEIFGLTADQVMDYYKHGGYSSWELYRTDPVIKRLMDWLITNGREDFRALYDDLLNRNDEYFVLRDFAAYCQAQDLVDKRYRDRESWLRTMVLNIAHAGIFSSDRTIGEYARDIWHLQPVEV